MTREEVISGLQMTMDLFLFDPATGEILTPDMLNDTDRVTYDACKGAIEALKAQTPCGDAVSRQTLQEELALYPIDDITSEDEAGYNRAINDVQKMVLHLPSAQLEIVKCKDCKFYTPMNRETKTGICRLLMHQNFGDDWYCAGAERRTDESD